MSRVIPILVYGDIGAAHDFSVRAFDPDPADPPYGQREYGARVPEGHRWWFATAHA